MVRQIFSLFAAMGVALAITFIAPPTAQAQPATNDVQQDEDEYLTAKREAFAWLLGTWESYYDQASNPLFNDARTGATLIFTMEPDGRVVGQIGETSEMMREAGYRSGMYVFRGLERSIAFAPGSSIYASRADGGQFRWIRSGGSDEWRETWIGIHQDGPNLQLPATAKGSLSGHADWIKIGGQGVAAAPRADSKCNIPAYNLFFRDEVWPLIDAFENDTGGIADHDTSTTTVKRHPYIQADFVEDEQDEEIRRWEGIVREIINNRGPDDFLRNNRRKILAEFRAATTAYLDAAREDLDCPAFTDNPGYTNVQIGSAMGMAIEIRQSVDVAEDLAQSRAVQEHYTRLFYEELGDVGSLAGEMRNAAIDAVTAALTEDGVERSRAEALVPQLDALRSRYANREAAGNPPDQFEVDRDMQAIFRRAGVDYDPAATSQELFGSAIAGGRSVAQLYRSMVLGKTLVPQGRTLGALSVLFDLAEIGNALLDLKALVTVNDEIMPVTLAVTEDAAHLAVLDERYRQFYADYETFAAEYQRLIQEAERRGEI
ncbi:MAG: hypothetical protein ABJP48_10370 [Erythrobacter sp.]